MLYMRNKTKKYKITQGENNMKINKKGHKFIVFGILISFFLLFVTCEDQGGETPIPQVPSQPSKPSEPSTPSAPSEPSEPSNPSEPSEPSIPSKPIPNNSYRVIYNKNAVDATGTMAYSDFTTYYYDNNKLRINNFVRNNYCFIGWAKTSENTTAEYTDGQRFTENLTTAGNTITLYAVWYEGYTVEVTAGSTLAEKFTWITNNAESYTSYIIEINSDYNLGSINLSYGAKKYVTIHLKGIGSVNNIEAIFNIQNGVTLILDGNLTFSSMSNNLINILGGNLILMNGTKITKSRGIYVNNGTITMNGGEISNNTATNGCGVYVREGTFTMNSGKIYNNTAANQGGGVFLTSNARFIMNGGEIYSNTGSGGGLYMNGGTFTMNGGEIYSNTGSGVSMNGGIFTMNGGEIYSNTGRGVYMDGGTFTMNGGKIYSNTGSSDGGGVYGGTFTMNGGKISGNTSNGSGGGVYVYGTFIMKNGEISSNNARSGGGGVCIKRNGAFNKTGGTITGSNSSNSNIVKDIFGNIIINTGHAVYVDGGSTFEKRKETTAGPGDNLSFVYNYDNSKYTWTGAWDY